MRNPYPSMGEPQDVDIFGHSEHPKEPMYRILSTAGLNSMISPATTADMFSPTNDELVEEKDMDAEDLLYQACDRGTVPTNPRAREVFGFNICQSQQQTACLLETYARVKNKGIHPKILGSWRTKATLEAHVGAILGASTSSDAQPSMQAGNQLQALPIMRALDHDMQAAAKSWTDYERLLRSKMKDYPACIKCGALHASVNPSSQQPVRRCARCKKVRYCSKECQVEDWNVHKSACKADKQSDQ